MKKLFLVSIFMITLSLALSVGMCDKAEAAEIVVSGSCGNNVTYTLDTDGLLTISGSGAMKDYPSSSAPWYSKMTSIKTVDILDGVTSIGKKAFSDCSNLTSVIIPDSVTSIGASAFVYCRSLASITIPNNVTSIESNTFYCCSGLTSVVIGNGVMSIGDYAFAGCDSLTSIMMPDNVTSICREVFSGCNSLQSVTIGDGVTDIGYKAFSYCRDLTSVTMGDNVTSIAEYAFEYCDSLANITIPDSVKSIGSYAFKECRGLTSVTIGDGVTSIGNYAFSYCSGLTSVTIGDSVTSIGKYAFQHCESLTSVTIPDSAKSIGYGAFSNCDRLTGVTIGNSVTSIDNYAFEYCESLTSVTIPDSVRSIGYGAFSSCRGLERVYITDIASWCNIYFGSSDANPLYFAEKLYINNSPATDIVIPDGVTRIPASAFSCDSLRSITIPDSVTSIGSYAFYNCKNLSAVYYIGSEEDWDLITIDSYNGCLNDAKLYTNVVWYDVSFIIIGEGEVSSHKQLNSEIVIEPVVSEKQGYVLDGWYVDENCTDKYGFSATVTSDTKFYARWLKLCTVSFNTNGGSTIDCQSVVEGGIATDPEIPKMKGHTFDGWYADEGCTTVYDFNKPVTTDIEIFAKWKEGAPIIGSGECGSNLTWTLDDDGNLVISGSGAMDNYPYYSSVPWYTYDTKITTITIPDGISTVGKYAFYNCSNLKYIFYEGSEADWSNISIGNYNTYLTKAIIIYSYKAIVAQFTENGVFIIENRTLVSYQGTDAEVTIPATANGVKINEIAENVFAEGTTIEKINIPDGITRIGKNAFAGTAYYKNAENWENGALYVGSYLVATNSELPNNFAAKQGTKSIASYAFSGQSSLLKIALPEGVINVDNYAFDGCTKITTVVLPKSLTRIGYSAFADCTAIEKVYFSGTEAVWNEINAGDENTPLTSCENIIYNIEGYFGDDSYYVMNGNSIILYLGNSSELNIPSKLGGKTVTTIGFGVFEGNETIEKVVLPDTITAISNSAFLNCVNLSDVTLPGNLKTLGAGAFSGCKKIEKIILPDTLTVLETGVFKDCTALKNIKLSDNLVSIGVLTFENCSNLKRIELPDTLKTIGGSAFYNTGLEYVIFPNSVTTIDELAFYKCKSLKNISFGNSLKTIKTSAFGYCTSLEEVIIPNSVTELGNSAFNQCTALRKMTIGTGVSFLPEAFMLGIDRLDELNFTSKITKLEAMSLAGGENYNYKSVKHINFVGTQQQFDSIEVETIDGICFEKKALQGATVTFINSLNEVANFNPKYVLEYELNGGSGSSFDFVMESVGTAITIPNTKPTKTDYLFGGWSTENDDVPEYQPGDTFSASQNTILYAVWGKTTVSLPKNVIAKAGETVTMDLYLTYNPGISSMNFKINYNTSVMKLKSVNNGTIFSDEQFGHGNLVNLCSVYLEDYDRNNTKNGVLVTLEFEILSGCANGYYDVKLNDFTAESINGSSVDVVVENSIVYVGEYLNDNATITVNGKIVYLENDSRVAGQIVISHYSKNKKLKGIKTFTAADGISYNFGNLESGDFAKVMCWGSLESAKPLIDFKEVNIS